MISFPSPMDPRSLIRLFLLFTCSLSFLLRTGSSSSVLFLDNPNHRFLRDQPSGDIGEYNLISTTEVIAAVPVLLGLAPPASLSAESSAKLNELLVPNPFDRPGAVFILDVSQAEDKSLSETQLKFLVGNAFVRKDLIDPRPVEIEFSDENEVYVSSLESSNSFDSTVIDKEMNDLAEFIGGSYSDGELIAPLPDGTSLSLYMSKKADSRYILSLLSLVHNIKTEVGICEDFSGVLHERAVLITRSFKGIQALQEEYGKGVVLDQGMQIFMGTLAKLFDSLRVAYQGNLVGIVLFYDKSTSASEEDMNVKVYNGNFRNFRLLEEASTPNATAVAEQKLVRRILAWTTGLILLVSTLIGVYLLVNMPLTRDTLLYSNVKLD